MPELLNGVAVLKTNVLKVEADSITGNVQTVKRPFTAIPYYAWANRGKGEMQVWIPEKIRGVELITKIN